MTETCKPTQSPQTAEVEFLKNAALYLDAGKEYRVTFECNRCEGYRWRAVNPARNVRRALKALRGERGDLDAIECLEAALEDLAHLAQWVSHDDVNPAKAEKDGS